MKRRYPHQHQKHSDQDLLLRTLRGSRLHGLEHDDSDYDYFEVYSGKEKMSQSIVGNVDTVRVSFDQFLTGIGVGLPEYLEALWSPLKTVNKIDYLHIHPGYSETLSRYQRTMKSFWLSGDFKRRRHALRLQLNVREYMQHGSFNPRLTDQQAEEIIGKAQQPDDYPRL